MKYFLSILTCFLFSPAVHSQPSSAAEKIIGNWLNEEKDAKIEIYKSENAYFGKLVWGDKIFEADGKTSRKDANNEDKELKNRDLLNLILLTNFIYDDGSWTGGKVYDPKSGKTYSCTIKFKGDKLEIRGYVGIALFGRTTTWSRANIILN
jgi:uncharacterized protein (DUF2147 family)